MKDDKEYDNIVAEEQYNYVSRNKMLLIFSTESNASAFLNTKIKPDNYPTIVFEICGENGQYLIHYKSIRQMKQSDLFKHIKVDKKRAIAKESIYNAADTVFMNTIKDIPSGYAELGLPSKSGLKSERHKHEDFNKDLSGLS